VHWQVESNPVGCPDRIGGQGFARQIRSRDFMTFRPQPRGGRSEAEGLMTEIVCRNQDYSHVVKMKLPFDAPVRNVMSHHLIDGFGRIHDSLRISVTDRCNIRCFYCMPEEATDFAPRQEILTFEEIERFVRVAADLGVNKLRLTGGEPLLRRGLPKLVERLAGVPGIQDIALTTNAVVLEQHAQPLYDAGLRRLNIHLDTLDRERFKQITRRDDLPRVLAGIDAAVRVGFQKIKLNIVAVKGLIEPDIIPMARYCRERGFEPRFIEFMPLDSQSLWDRSKVLLADDIMALLAREISPLIEVPDRDPRAPATDFAYADGGGEVGFVASVSKPFCMNCNRLRLTSDGKIRYCLFAIEETDVKGLLRSGASDEEIAAAIKRNVAEKWIGHQINSTQFVAPPRPMYSIGG
jgi:GTP 3',8-cyclase